MSLVKWDWERKYQSIEYTPSGEVLAKGSAPDTAHVRQQETADKRSYLLSVRQLLRIATG